MMNRVATIVTRHWKPLLGLNALLLAATIGIAVSTPRVWMAKMAFILPTTTSNLNANLGPLGNISDGNIGFSKELNPLKIQSSILLSDGLMSQVWASDPEKSLYPTLNSYKALFSVSPQSQSTIISLAVNGSSPELARKRAVALAEAYQRRLDELRRNDSTAREHLKQGELERGRRNLNQAQAALAEFKQSSGLINSEEQTKGMVSTITTLRAAQAQALAQVQSNQARAKTLSARLKLSSNQAVRSLGLSENQDYQFTRQKLSEVEAALVESQVRRTDEHPQVRGLISQRDELRRQLKGYIAQAAGKTVGIDTTVNSNSNGGRQALIQQLILAETEGNAQQLQATQLQSEIDKLNTTLRSIPVNQARVLELQRQYDITEGLYKGLVAQVQETKLNTFRAYPSVQVLDQSAVDPNPSSPNLKLLALGALIASAFSSFGLVLLLEERNPLLSLKDLQGIAFPVAIQIPWLKRPVTELARGAEAEVEFQQLASAISLLSPESRRLLITSSTFGEGKTTVTIGLAAALVDLGFRVLIVDGDFRRAELSKRLGYSQERRESGVTLMHLRPGLDLVPTLPKQDKIVEFVAQGHFKQWVESFESSDDYDFVLVDTAPVGLTSETALMSAAIPKVLFVVQPGISSRNPTINSLEQLVQANAQIAALVINGAEVQNQGYGRQLYASQVLQPNEQRELALLGKHRQGV